MAQNKKSRLAACVFSLLASVLSFAPALQAQSLRTDLDLGAQWRVNSTARLIAGISPTMPAHIDFAETEAWKEHSAYMKSAWAKLNAKWALDTLPAETSTRSRCW